MATLTKFRTLQIAIVEDDPSDLSWLQQLLGDLQPECRLTVATDGEQARDFILKHGKYRGFPPADLIFLDMNLPNSQDSKCFGKSVERYFFPRKVSYLSKPIDRDSLLKCLRSHQHLKRVAEQYAKH